MKRDLLNLPTWGIGNTADRTVKSGELTLEHQVSEWIGRMSFLWLAIEDEAGPESLRGYIERNSIALLSNYNRDPLDPPSENWLGRQSDRERVRKSGLWNQNCRGLIRSGLPRRSRPACFRCEEGGMIVVIQCAATKRPDAGHLITTIGKPVNFELIQKALLSIPPACMRVLMISATAGSLGEERYWLTMKLSARILLGSILHINYIRIRYMND
jgi:hypothetical protein